MQIYKNAVEIKHNQSVNTTLTEGQDQCLNLSTSLDNNFECHTSKTNMHVQNENEKENEYKIIDDDCNDSYPDDVLHEVGDTFDRDA